MSITHIPFLSLLSNIVDNRGKTCPTSDGGIPLIATNCIRNENLYPSFAKVRFVNDDTYRNWFRAHPKPGDIIFVTKGTPGRVCWVPDPVNFCIAQDMLALRANEEIVYPKYLFALLRSPLVQERIVGMHVGSLIPHFKKGDFDKLLIPVESDLSKQKEIGDLYFALCDKIELNNQINKNLEALAQAIFKRWFIDFEFPDENGQPYKSSGGEMVESSIGLIPKEWNIVSLLNFVNLIGGGTPKTSIPNYWDGHIKWLSAKDVTANEKTFVLCTEKLITKEGLDNSSAKLLPQFSTIISARGTVGNYCITSEPGMTISQSNYALKNPDSFDFYTYLMVGTLISEMKQRSYGTVFDTITTKTLADIKIINAPKQLISSFEEIVSPFYEAILNNCNENLGLQKLRDILLPKLISGEIEIKQADKILEEV